MINTTVFHHINFDPNTKIEYEIDTERYTNHLTFGDLHVFMTTKQAQNVCNKINAVLRMKEGTED